MKGEIMSSNNQRNNNNESSEMTMMACVKTIVCGNINSNINENNNQ